MGTRNTNRSEDDLTTDGDDAPSEEGAVVSRKPGRMDRIRTSVQSANVDPERSNMSTKWAIDKLDEREKRFSFAAAGGAILFAVIIYLSETSNPNFRLAKNQLTPQTVLVIGIVAGALLVGATLLGRRAPVGFVGLFTGIAFSGDFFFLGLPFIALAVWLLYRSYKIQRQSTANARSDAAGTGSLRSRAGAASGRSAPSGRGSASKSPAKVEPNKRYTPPKPAPSAKASRSKPPQSKPSRRERKAALKDS